MTISVAARTALLSTFMMNLFLYKNYDFKIKQKILKVIITWLQCKRSKFGNRRVKNNLLNVLAPPPGHTTTDIFEVSLQYTLTVFWDLYNEEKISEYLLTNVIYSRLYQVTGSLRTKKN